MKKLIVVIITNFVLLACRNEVIQKPKKLLSKTQMEEILYELAIANAAQTTDLNVIDQYDIDSKGYIYAKFKIDSVQFASSVVYYASNPGEQLQIYRNVEKHLERLRDKVKRQNEIERQARDSLFELKLRKNEKISDSMRR